MTTDTEQPRPWVPTDETFAARLAMVRQKRGWNIKEAAAACGFPQVTWRGWELEDARPRNLVTTAKQIASAAGCDYLWLLLGPDRDGSVRTDTQRYGFGERIVAISGDPFRAEHAGPRRPVRRRPGGDSVLARRLEPLP